MKKKAFTLAEILVVLFATGILAMMTIPNLVKNTQDAQFKTAYKKAYSTISQAYRKLADNYEFDSSKIWTTYNFDLFKKEFGVAKDCPIPNGSECWNPNGEMACTDSCGGGLGRPSSNEPSFIDKSGMA